MHDEQAKPRTGPVNSSSAATRHRLDSGSAAQSPDAGRPMMEGPHNSIGETKRAMSERPEPIRLERLSFGEALIYLRNGERVARAGWNGKGQFLALQVPDFQSKMTLPYIYIRTVPGDLVPWLASQTDLLSFDWCLVRDVVTLQYGHGGEEF